MANKIKIKMISAYGATSLCILVLVFLLIEQFKPKTAETSLAVTLVSDSTVIDVLNSANDNEIYVKLTCPDYSFIQAPPTYIYRDSNDIIIKMKGFPQMESPGNPALPCLQRQIALPPASVTKTVDFKVVHIVEKEIDETYSIAPVPPLLMDQERPTEEQIYWELTKWGEFKEVINGRNILVYEQDAFYPSECCQVKTSGQLRKWKAASIYFSPFRYNPVKSKLIVTEEVILKITYKKNAEYFREKNTKRLMRDDSFDDYAKKLFINYNQAKEWYQRALKDDVPSITDNINDPDYVIITTNDIYNNCNELDNFCFHKQDLGYTVMVVTEDQKHIVDGISGAYTFLNEVGGYEAVTGEPPDGRSEKIRKWLQTNYLLLGIKYVLLIGNPDPDNPEPDDLVGDIPMQIGWAGIVSEVPNDLYYADLSGDWNLDEDDYIGEWYDFADPDGYAYSNLPTGITGTFFCTRWNGILQVSDAEETAQVIIYYLQDGQLKIWLDKENDGFDDEDLIKDDNEEHSPEIGFNWEALDNGNYPIRIEYRQSSDDAYLEANVTYYAYISCNVRFAHDDGAGNYDDGLVAQFFNDNDFSEPHEAEIIQNYPLIKFVVSGDKGDGGIDVLPEVIVGRIPFYEEDEDGDDIPDYAIIDNILQKIMSYENASIHEEPWRKHVLASFPNMYTPDINGNYTVADYLGGETLMDLIAPALLWTWFRIHEEDYPDVIPDADINTGCNVDDMVTAWNDPTDPDDGRGIVMWRTHGSQTGADYVFEEERLDELDNEKPSIVIQTTCLNGKPEEDIDRYDIHHYPLGYTLLKQGAIGTYSSSRISWGGLFDPDDIDIANKLNQNLMYFFTKGIVYNQTLGKTIYHVLSKDIVLDESWKWMQVLNYDLFGDPSLSLFGPNPLSNNDIIFLLDGSGSMLNEGKWDAAINASVLFYDLMKVLRHPAFNDRYNTVVFRWPCSGSGADMTTRVPPFSELKALSIPYTSATLAPYEPLANYCTPIGSGLDTAINALELESEESFYSNKKILLLSDGKHNRGTDPLSIVIPEESGINVEAIGLGEDYIEPEIISNIAISTGGEYRITPNPREIIDYFVQILCNTSWKLQNIPVISEVVTIDHDYAVFIVAWDNPDVNIQFELDPPGGLPNITPSNLSGYPPMEVNYHHATAGKAYAFYICKNIPDELLGDWGFTNINNEGVPVESGDVLLKSIEDPRILADFSIDARDYCTGQQIILKAEITEDGQPKINLNDVWAKLVSSPYYAIGDIMARNEPSSDYPSQTQGDRTQRSHYLFGVMENLGITSLIDSSEYNIMLKDDGIGADSKANDGIYTGTFNNTEKEGSYTFNFFASGKNKNDKNFKRGEKLSQYVKFAASPKKTKVDIISTVKNKLENTASTTVKVTPRNKYGSFMGPFAGERIALYTNYGKFEKQYADYKDGSYTFNLVHPINVRPEISVSVNNVVVVDQMPAKVKTNIHWIIILIIILILLLIYIYRQYKTR